MGTRADFYVGRGESAEWLGSIAWDGYPDGIDATVLTAKTLASYKRAVAKFFTGRKDVTFPSQGWPWPWETSSTTDYAYAFDGKTVFASCFGHRWFKATAKKEPDDDSKSAVFPNMKSRQNVTMGKRSGVMVIGVNGPIDCD